MKNLKRQDRNGTRTTTDIERKYKLGQIDYTAEQIEELKMKLVVDSSLSATSPNAIANSVVTNALNNKVNKETGKGLSTNDFTNADKEKLDNMGDITGVPTGGTTGQVLTKKSDEDNDTYWATPTGGSTGSGEIVGDTLPIGAVIEWDSDTIPTNWLLLNGQAVSRTTYSELFALYGTRYGAGDGSTTFNLPNRKTRVSVGKDSSDSDFTTLGKTGGEKKHTLTINEMPKHSHNTQGYNRTHIGISDGGESMSRFRVDGDPVDSGMILETGGDQPHNNLQPYFVTNFIVKAKQSAAIITNVIDNLTSTSSTDVLSAKQGKVLSDEIKAQTLAFYENGGTTDANTTIKPLVLTKVNTPTTDFWYVETLFYGSIATTSNRKQIAYGYKFDAPIYTRYYISGTWSEWTTGEIKSSSISDYEGHIWFKNGMLLQWGEVIITPTAANTVTSAEVTFPIAYGFAPFITASPQIAYPNACTCSVGVGSTDAGAKAGMKIYMTRTNTSATNFRWIAIGFKSA